MNRTIATCMAGMRRKATSRTRIHFFHRPREAERFMRRFFAFGAGIFAKRPLGRTERNSGRARIFANAQNARRCSPVSDIPITEKLLLNAERSQGVVRRKSNWSQSSLLTQANPLTETIRTE